MKKVIYILFFLLACQAYAQKGLGGGGGGTYYTMYRDLDGDSYGNPNVTTVTNAPIAGWVLNNTDCNDSDPNVTLGYVWYQDIDGDGFGDPNSTLTSCPQPSGYVSNNTDACPTVAGTNNGCPAVGLTNHVFGDYNYVYEEILQIAATEATYNSVMDNQKIRSISFFDGLGRTVQTRAIGASPLGKDIVTHVEYDNLGRASKKYLPYTSGQSNGYYESGGQTKTVTHYNTTKYGNTTNPYTEKRFEQSPLNRLLETGAPGTSWAVNPTSDTDHTLKMNYAVNTATDNLHKVRYYKVDANNNLTNPSPTYFPIGSLRKTIVKDENWTPTSGKLNTTEEFTDKYGQTVLKRTYAEIGVTVTPHDTYYVHDTYNNLSFVIPPKAITSNGISPTELADLCYQYKYDKYNRLVEKKLPGKGWEYTVYDKMNRPILIQDAVQRAKSTKEWLFTKYDAYGRVAYTGLYKNNGSRAALQLAADNHSVKYESVGNTFYSYSNNAYPTNITLSDIYMFNYYDGYYFNPAGLSIPSSVYGVSTTTNVNSLPTGSRERVLIDGTNYWITSIIGYDDKARTIYNASINTYLNTTDINQIKLDFAGKVIESDSHHTSNVTISIVDKFTYDHVGRMLTQKQTINTLPEELIVKNTYDELGVLESKKVGNTENNPLQNIDYKYNVRGWLTSINDVNSIGTDLFTFKINYNTKEMIGHTSEYIPIYNGNISETIWRTQSDNVKRGSQYTYDALNRIKGSGSKQNETLSSSIGSMGFQTYYNYDKNGNLTSLYRAGMNNIVDNLAYTYSTDSNKLTSLTDSSGNTEGVYSNTTYTYEVNNGNLTQDTAKGITNIEYNHLDLPTKVHFGSAKRIEYIYTAGGSKVEKKLIDGATTTTEYAGSFIYVNSILKHFNQPEGYVDNNNGLFTYVYQYADHLGNIRLNYANVGSSSSINLQIREENNYYPFGMKHGGYNNAIVGVQDNYKYNGKEFQDEMINGKALQWYDYGARNYDVSTGRFFNIDPLADSPMQIDKSPYAYTWNNPMNMTDPDGMHADFASDRGWMDCSTGDCNYGMDEQGNISGSGTNSSNKGDIHVVRYADGTVTVVSKEKYSKYVNNGVKVEGNKEFFNAAARDQSKKAAIYFKDVIAFLSIYAESNAEIDYRKRLKLDPNKPKYYLDNVVVLNTYYAFPRETKGKFRGDQIDVTLKDKEFGVFRLYYNRGLRISSFGQSRALTTRDYNGGLSGYGIRFYFAGQTTPVGGIIFQEKTGRTKFLNKYYYRVYNEAMKKLQTGKGLPSLLKQ